MSVARASSFAKPPESTYTLPMSSTRADGAAFTSGLTDLITRSRPLLCVGIAALYLACFNGLWRVGLDSALYRGVADSLASGRGYQFAGEHNTLAFPGLPFLLAGFQRVVGTDPAAPIFFMCVLALVTLWLLDRLIRLHHPKWIATVVVAGVAFNGRYLMQSQELMTDIPFLLGMILSLYAWERLQVKEEADHDPSIRLGQATHDLHLTPIIPVVSTPMRIGFASLLTLGLAIAVVMRPTFWVIGLAMLLVTAFRLLRRSLHLHRARVPLLASAAFIVVSVSFLLLDPRSISGAGPGMYERDFFYKLTDLPQAVRQQFFLVFGRNLNIAFFGQHMSILTPIVSVVFAVSLLGSTLLIARRHSLWFAMVWITVGVTLVFQSNPRYYLMVLPMLWLSWTLLTVRVAGKVNARARDIVLAVGIYVPVVLNAGHIVNFLTEQRRPDLAWFAGKDRYDAFLQNYRDGSIPELQTLATLVQTSVSETDTVLGPQSHILAYYSGRRVVGEQLLLGQLVEQYPQVLRDAEIRYVVLPVTRYRLSDELLERLIRARVIVGTREVARQGDDYVAKLSIVVPENDWRNNTLRWGPPPKKRKSNRASITPESVATTAKTTTAPTTSIVRKQKKSSPPIVTPTQTTQPTSVPTKRRKKKPATRPAIKIQSALPPATQASAATMNQDEIAKQQSTTPKKKKKKN